MRILLLNIHMIVLI